MRVFTLMSLRRPEWVPMSTSISEMKREEFILFLIFSSLMNPHYQSNKSIEAHKEDLRLLKNPSGVSLPPSTRSYNHQNLLTE